MLHAFRPLGRLANGLYRQSACVGSAKISSSALVSSGLDPVGPAEAAREQDRQGGDTDYNATPQYPNKTPDASTASKGPLPSGPMDTSSVNDPSGRAEGSYQQQQSPDSHSMHVHHPGREADAANAAGSSGGSGNSGSVQPNVDQDSFTAGSGGSTAARIDEPGSGPSGEGEAPRNLNAGVETTNVIPGAERAMTADFAAGGDDVNPTGSDNQLHDSTPVNPVSGLPQMGDAEDAGTRSGRFGGLKNPDQVGEQGMTARQTEKSTGMDPGGHSSG